MQITPLSANRSSLSKTGQHAQSGLVIYFGKRRGTSPAASPTLSPVRPDPATLAALETLAAQRQALAQVSPIASFVGQASPNLIRQDPATKAAIDSLLAQAQVLAQASSPIAPPVGQPILNPINRPGPSTQSDIIHPSIPPHNPNAPMQDMLERILKNQLNHEG